MQAANAAKPHAQFSRLDPLSGAVQRAHKIHYVNLAHGSAKAIADRGRLVPDIQRS